MTKKEVVNYEMEQEEKQRQNVSLHNLMSLYFLNKLDYAFMVFETTFLCVLLNADGLTIMGHTTFRLCLSFSRILH